MSTMSNEDQSFILEALPAFLSEASEQLATVEQLLLALEESPDDREMLDALFRCVHTVKGSAGIFGLMGVVEFTHHVETLLDKVREGQVALTPSLGTLLLESADTIRHLIQVAGNPALDSASLVDEREGQVRQLQALSGAPSPHQDAVPNTEPVNALDADRPSMWNISAAFGSDTFRNGMDPLAIVAYLQTLGSLTHCEVQREHIPPLESLDAESCHLTLNATLATEAGRDALEAAFAFVREDSSIQIEPVAQAAPLANGASPEPQAKAEATPATAVADTAAQTRSAKPRAATAPDDHRYIRVQADRLDAVINLLGELVVASAGAEMLARHTRQGTLIEANLHMGRLIEEIRNGTLQLRMVPIGETFGRFRRVVRDTAAELGKEVHFEITGGETELDKSVVEKIADPLMHLVRNALDHGLERPDDREATGKPAAGTLHLTARHEAGSIVICIQDDGRGIHRQKVLQRAWDRGLVDRAVTPSDAEILRLIFEPGFSTAEQVTNLSGRGVGMDVVRSNIEALRGTVQISSTEGAGTLVTIRLPLTLAIIDGFLVSVAHSRFILPLESVVEVVERRQPQNTMDSRGSYCVELRGEVLPVISLRKLYAFEGEAPERISIVVVNAGGVRYAIEVDTLLGQHQTVIKPLGKMFRTLRGISGSSILGDGEVALIFDILSLGQLATASPSPAFRAPAESPALT
jgi:two-component system chemotaxis sensor kinase CheA